MHSDTATVYIDIIGSRLLVSQCIDPGAVPCPVVQIDDVLCRYSCGAGSWNAASVLRSLSTNAAIVSAAVSACVTAIAAVHAGFSSPGSESDS